MLRSLCAVAAGCLLVAGLAHAQTPAAAAPPAPTAQAPADPFPPTDPKYFTAKSPTVDTVNSFLKALWGYEVNREWRVEAIQATSAPNVSKVVVFVTEKQPNAQVQSTTFYVTPDGKHAIAEGAGIIQFGADPFADLRATLQAKANGPWRGSPDKNLEFVEFADLQCPHCKEAQPIMDQLMKDFPKAHIVFQPFPLVEIHSSAFKAAAYGNCVAKLNGNETFFKYADAVFDTQEQLTPTGDDAVLRAAATKAGADAAKVAACSVTPETKDSVNADIKLADDSDADQTPLLSVNGRMLPITSMSYEQLKQIIEYQAQLDHVETGAASAPQVAGAK